MNLTFACRLPSSPRTAEQVWDDLKGVTARLSQVDSLFAQWWANPRGPKDAYVPLADRQAFLARLLADEQALAEEFPNQSSSGSSGALLTNAGNDKDWKQRGAVALTYFPDQGQWRLQLHRVEKVYAEPARVAWALLNALAGDERVTFVQTNVQQLIDGQLLLYSVDRAVFPHREFLGWMGYVNRPLTLEDVPEAARVEARGKGSLILSTQILDLGNAAAVKQTNQVEMALADLELLPVIDPSLG